MEVYLIVITFTCYELVYSELGGMCGDLAQSNTNDIATYHSSERELLDGAQSRISN